MASQAPENRFWDTEGQFRLPEIVRALDDNETLPPELVGNLDLADALFGYLDKTAEVLSDEQLSERRQLVIRQLRDSAFETGFVPTRGSESAPPVCAIVMGQTGAGKSSVVARPVANHLQAWLVDADAIKESLPEYRQGFGNQAVHDESSVIRTQFEMRVTNQQESYVHQMIGDDLDALREIIEVNQALGYRVWLYLVNVSETVAVARTTHRFRTGKQGYIPPSVTLAIGNAPLTNYNLAKGYADGYAQIDNDDQPKCVEVHNAWVPESF